jgi:RNA polymerase sigma factor (sigma-70 family)
MLAIENDVDVTSGLAPVFMAHRQNLMRFLKARCRGLDVGEVEDVVQELWLRCSAVETSNINDPKSYLFRMGQNLIFDRERRRALGQNCEADWAYVNARAEGAVEEATAERSLIARDQLEQINKAMKKLGERAVWIFHRFRVDGALQEHIAVELGVSVSTVERDLRKAYETIAAVEVDADEH